MLTLGWLAPLGIARAALAAHIGVDPRDLAGVLDGTKPLTPGIAVRIAAALDIDAEQLLVAQVRIDLAKARRPRILPLVPAPPQRRRRRR